MPSRIGGLLVVVALLACRSTREPQDAGPPGVAFASSRALDALQRYRALWPSHSTHEMEVTYVVFEPPEECWPSDPACMWVLEYGLDRGSAKGGMTVLGRCRVHAHSGVIACAATGKTEKVIGTVFNAPEYVHTVDASR